MSPYCLPGCLFVIKAFYKRVLRGPQAGDQLSQRQEPVLPGSHYPAVPSRVLGLQRASRRNDCRDQPQLTWEGLAPATKSVPFFSGFASLASFPPLPVITLTRGKECSFYMV